MVSLRLALATAALWCGCTAAAHATVAYNSFPTVAGQFNTLAWNDNDNGARTLTSQFGDAVGLAGSNRVVSAVSVLLSSAARQANYAGVGTEAGFVVPMVLTLYKVSGTAENVGAVISSSRATVTIPWDTGSDSLSKSVTFEFNVVVPTNLVVGLSFDGSSGPASELGFVFADSTLTGSDLSNDIVEWGYTDGSGTTAFGPNTGWSGLGVPAIQIEVATPVAAVPEPASLLLLATAVPALGLARRRAKTGA